MRYYKIIQNGAVVGAGTMFLKYYPTFGRFFYCDFEEAQVVQDVIKETFYHADWLRKIHTLDGYEIADVELIDAVEYDEIIEMLRGGEEIPVEPDVVPEPTPEPEPEPDAEPERPMTVQEMRERILEQQDTIDMLTECLLEMSEMVYGG